MMNRLAILTVMMVLLSGCTKPVWDNYGSISGEVLDSRTRRPIEDVKVTLSPEGVVQLTGKDGSFSFDELGQADYTLTISKDGYLDVIHKVSVKVGMMSVVNVSLELVFDVENSSVEILTAPVSDYTSSTAHFSASIVALNGHEVTEKGFCWNTTGLPSLTDGHMIADDRFSLSVSGLEPETKYYVSGYVKTSQGRVFYGNDEVFTTTPEPKNPTSGLYTYYTFEDNCNNTVEGAHGGIEINSPQYVDGVGNSKAIKFSSADNSYMNVPESMIDSYAFSVSFWVKGLSDGKIFHVASQANYSMSNGLLMLGGLLNYIPDGYGLKYHQSYNDARNELIHQSFDPDQWTHVAITVQMEKYVSEIICLYVDGKLIDRQDLWTSQVYDSIGKGTKFVLGGSYETAGNTIVPGASMTIDNLRIYNTRSLSDEEVRQIYEYEKE